MGKQNKVCPSKKKVDASWTVNTSVTARNLSKNQLGGVIFGCKYHTFSECMTNKIFGLPAAHYSYVKNITPGLPLFLFNYSDRRLHGVFEAISCGQMDMSKYAWAACEGVEYTPYPAQVRMDCRTECRPLSEDEFKPLIEKNYYAEKFFWFELDKAQSGRLVQLFLSSVLPKKTPRPPRAPKQVNMFDALSSPDDIVAANDEGKKFHSQIENSYAAVLVNTHASDPTDKKWADLFRGSSSSSHAGLSKPPPKALPDAVDIGGDPRVVDFWTEDVSQPLNGWEEQAFVGHTGWEEQAVLEHNDSGWEEQAVVQHNVPKEMYENAVLDRNFSGWEDEAVVQRNVPQEMYENADLQCGKFDSERVDQWGAPSSDVAISSDGDSSESEALVSKVQFDLANMAVLENRNALSGERLLTITHAQFSDFESVIRKTKQEIEGFKFSQLKQRLKMDFLEQELVHSKLEIEQLKKRCHRLESMRSFISEQCDVEDCTRSEEYVLIVGGFDGKSGLPDLSMYFPFQDNVVSLCPMTFPRSSASVAKLNGELYIFGGVHDCVWYDTVESYNPIINKWVQRPSLSKKKGSMAGASLYETIFAMGGGNGVECLSDVELLDQNIGSWMSTQSMLEKRMGASAACMNGAIYVAGGFDGKEYLRSVERFDPREHAWSRVPSMQSKRGSHSLVALKGEIYALGGYDGQSVVSSVEVFDPRIGSWLTDDDMTVARVNFGCFVLGGKIYVIGGDGMTGKQGSDVMEFYEPGRGGWQVIANPSFVKKSFFSALVI